MALAFPVASPPHMERTKPRYVLSTTTVLVGAGRAVAVALAVALGGAVGSAVGVGVGGAADFVEQPARSVTPSNAEIKRNNHVSFRRRRRWHTPPASLRRVYHGT